MELIEMPCEMFKNTVRGGNTVDWKLWRAVEGRE